MKTPARRQIASWEEAELNARDWMRAWGFRDAELTPPGADSGVDVRSRAAVAQVKYEARDVGRPYLQMLVGARGNKTDSRMLFFTGSRYTEQARNYAEEMDIALFHYKLDGGMEAVNKPAEALLKGRGRAAQNQSVDVPAGEKKNPVQYRVIRPFTNAVGLWIVAFSILLFLIQLFVPGHQINLLTASVLGLLLGLLVIGTASEPVPEPDTAVSPAEPFESS